MSEFAVVISCKLNESDDSLTSFILDTVDDTNVESSSVMTTHPIVTGDIVSDHIYNQPNSLTLTGVFSLNGSKGIVVNQEGAKLEKVQTLFEKIKREGILCDIVKVHTTESNDVRFKLHENMVLTRISWTEKINSLDFTFTFNQALLVDIEEYEIKKNDEYLPDITEPQTLNFTDTLIDWDSINASISEMLKTENLITDGFLTYLSGMSATSLVALGVSLVVAKIVVSTFMVSKTVGLIVGAIAASVAVVYGIVNIIKRIINKNKYKIEQFKLYKEEEKNRKEVKRYCDFQDEIHKNLLQLNNSINVYNVGSDVQQECLLSIDDNYYSFIFTKNNTTNTYGLVVKDMNEITIGICNDISSSPTNFSQLNSTNSIFRTEGNGKYVYLICSNEDKSKLTNYYIVVSSMNLDKYNEAVVNIIRNSLLY